MSDLSDSHSDCGKKTSSSVIPSKKAKRLTKYNQSWENSYSWLKQVKENPYHASCRLCNKDFSCAHGGLSDVKQHASTKSHKTIVSNRASSNLTQYFSKPDKSASETEEKIAAGELASVYHTVRHSLSYNSMDCSHKLLPYICSDSKIAQKFSCGRTKAESIICEILAKESVKNILKTAHEKNLYFSIATDASNKKKTEKCFQFAYDTLTTIQGFKIVFSSS